MSDELAVMVASSMGPGQVADLLDEAMQRLRETYPSAELWHVGVDFGASERRGNREERRIRWSVQANNERGTGESSDEAFKELAKDWDDAQDIPVMAARVAAVLREIPEENFVRHHVMQQAQTMLDEERRNRR